MAIMMQHEIIEDLLARVQNLENRVARLESDLATLKKNHNTTPLNIYESIPYYFNPDFKLLIT